MALSDKPAREDLTDRECVKLLGSTIGGLCQMADTATVYRAVRWCADNPEDWKSTAGYVMTLKDVVDARKVAPGLSKDPAREDLTDVECAHLFVAAIVGVAGMSNPTAVYRGVRWWADTPEVWKMFGFDPLLQAPS